MKSEFPGKFLLERGVGVDTWTLAAPLAYCSALLQRRLEVPAGFSTDFASIPRVFHRLLPKNGLYDPAAVVHDWLYATGELHKDTADKVFLEAMRALSVSAWRCLAMYQAVVRFGGPAWRAHRATPHPASAAGI